MKLMETSWIVAQRVVDLADQEGRVDDVALPQSPAVGDDGGLEEHHRGRAEGGPGLGGPEPGRNPGGVVRQCQVEQDRDHLMPASAGSGR